MKSLALLRKVMVPAMLLFLMVAGVVSTQAQVPTAQPAMTTPSSLTYGVRLGMGAGTFKGDAVQEDDSRIGFDAGLYLSYRIRPYLAIQPEVNFAYRKLEARHQGLPVALDQADYTFGMLDVPVLLRLYPFAVGRTQPSLFAGPMVSYQIYRDVEPVEDMLPPLDEDNQYKRGMFGLTFGLGLERPVLGRPLQFDTRYVLGLTDLFRSENYPEMRLEGWTFSLGIGL